MSLFAKWLESSIGDTTSPITSAIANAKFMGFYISNSATSGISVGHYMRLYVTGTGGGGCAGRFYCDLTGTSASGGSGIQATCGLGESTTAGHVSGLGTGVYANVFFPNAAVSGGTYAAINCELYSGGSSTDVSATRSSFIRFNVGGTADKVDASVYLFDLSGFTSASGSVYYYKGSAITPTNLYGVVRVITPNGAAYIPLYNGMS
jgi:hypothetical protein